VSENGHVNIVGEGRFLSHSFNPNLVVRVHEFSSHPIDFVARRDIAQVTNRGTGERARTAQVQYRHEAPSWSGSEAATPRA
jgi:hypothetical protein